VPGGITGPPCLWGI